MRADQILRAGLDILVERGEQRDQPSGERTSSMLVALPSHSTGTSTPTTMGPA